MNRRADTLYPDSAGLYPIREGRIGQAKVFHDPNRTLTGATIYAAGGPLEKPEGWKGVGKVKRPLLAVGSTAAAAKPEDEAKPAVVSQERRGVSERSVAGDGRQQAKPEVRQPKSRPSDEKAREERRKLAREEEKRRDARMAKEAKAERDDAARRADQAKRETRAGRDERRGDDSEDVKPAKRKAEAPRSRDGRPGSRTPTNDAEGSDAALPPAFAPAKTVFQTPTAEQEAANYQIGPEDVLKVTVYGHDDLTQVVVVQPDGAFTFPLLGRVVASGTSPDSLATQMAETLAKGFVRNPQVSVVVQEYRSKTVFVVGEVAKPGSYAIQGTMTLVEVLSKAAPTTNAGSEVVIVRPRGGVKGPVLPDDAAVAGFEGATLASQLDADVLKVNMRDIQMGRLDRNVALAAGDTVFVTQAGKVYVLGEVRNPGAYTYQPGLTVRQAISLAGGYTADAATGKVRVIRDTAKRAKDEIKVELDAAVQAGDTVIVKAKLF